MSEPKHPETCKPKYEHDCEKCIFLGSHIDKNNFKVDLYFCKQVDRSTIISRYGNEFHDYISGIFPELNEKFNPFEGLSVGYYFAVKRDLF